VFVVERASDIYISAMIEINPAQPLCSFHKSPVILDINLI
jgi:hypothetical protein